MIYCENIVNVTLFFFFTLPRFRTTLFFFFPIFGNAIATIVTIFFPILAMALPQLVCQFLFIYFFSLWALHAHLSHPGSRIGQRNFDIHVVEIQHFLSPPFSSSLSYFWLNFGNDNTEIQSLSSKSQISFNSSYNAK